MGAEILYNYKYAIQGFAFNAPNQEILDQVLGFLQNEPSVSVEQDQITVPFADELPTGILRIDAAPPNNEQGYSSRDVDSDIAIIDSGVDLDHPDLNVYRNITVIIPGGESSNNREFADKYIERQKIALNTYENKLTPYPPFSLDTSPSGDDKCGHGTQVAGVAAARDNSVGVLGVAPGAKVWAVKVLEFDKSTGKCEGSISSAIAGINFVTRNAHEIDVANLSFGCLCKSDALHEAISRSIAAGVTYVVAAGNIKVDAATFSPANHPDVITVSAIADKDGKCGGLGPSIWVDAGNMSGLADDDTFAQFSNYGSSIDIAAPGVKINSTYPNGTYALAGGTSVAAPHVSGTVALLKQALPHESPSEMETAVKESGVNSIYRM